MIQKSIGGKKMETMWKHTLKILIVKYLILNTLLHVYLSQNSPYFDAFCDNK